MLGSEHIQTPELAQVEAEKEVLVKNLIDRNEEVIILKLQMEEL